MILTAEVGSRFPEGDHHNERPHWGRGCEGGKKERWNIAGGDNDKMLFLIANCKNSLVLQRGMKVKTEERTTVVINDKLYYMRLLMNRERKSIKRGSVLKILVAVAVISAR